jgi:hypothetical protein
MAIASISLAGSQIADKTSGSTSLISTLSIPSGSVPIGSCVVVPFSMDPSAGTVTCADSRGNTYTPEFDIANGSGTTGVRTLVFVAYNIATALASLDTITISHPAAASRAMAPWAFSGVGVNHSDGFDASASNTGASTAVNLTTGTNVAFSSEAALMVVGSENNTAAHSWAAPLASLNFTSSSGGSAVTNVAIDLAWANSITSGSTFTGQGSTTGSTIKWAAALFTLKLPNPQKYMRVMITTI